MKLFLTLIIMLEALMTIRANYIYTFLWEEGKSCPNDSPQVVSVIPDETKCTTSKFQCNGPSFGRICSDKYDESLIKGSGSYLKQLNVDSNGAITFIQTETCISMPNKFDKEDYLYSKVSCTKDVVRFYSCNDKECQNCRLKNTKKTDESQVCFKPSTSSAKSFAQEKLSQKHIYLSSIALLTIIN